MNGGEEGESERLSPSEAGKGGIRTKRGSVGGTGRAGDSCHLHKVGVFGVSDSDHGMHLLDQLLFLVIIELHVPLGQARLACSVLDEDEADLGMQEEEAGREVGWASHCRATLPNSPTLPHGEDRVHVSRLPAFQGSPPLP